MITPEVAQLLAADRSAQLQRAVTSARLVALARCCRSSHWGQVARRAAQALTGLRHDRVPVAACCAGA
jgi:hypothetical protein